VRHKPQVLVSKDILCQHRSCFIRSTNLEWACWKVTPVVTVAPAEIELPCRWDAKNTFLTATLQQCPFGRFSLREFNLLAKCQQQSCFWHYQLPRLIFFICSVPVNTCKTLTHVMRWLENVPHGPWWFKFFWNLLLAKHSASDSSCLSLFFTLICNSGTHLSAKYQCYIAQGWVSG